jgi:hypothetical protein
LQDKANFEKVFPDYDPTDMVSMDILPDAIAASINYAVRQAEELFCDLFSYALFGESYLHAFAYILAPGGGACDSNYPLLDEDFGGVRCG